MEQQTPIPPQIKDEAVRRVKTRHFPILDLGSRVSRLNGPVGGKLFASVFFPEGFNLISMEI